MPRALSTRLKSLRSDDVVMSSYYSLINFITLRVYSEVACRLRKLSIAVIFRVSFPILVDSIPLASLQGEIIYSIIYFAKMS
jgi:hypothetical protein